MTEPTYSTVTVQPFGRRWLITCPRHGRLYGHWPDKEMAEVAWREHIDRRHAWEGDE